jgi:Flp pilus assembly protein TadD
MVYLLLKVIIAVLTAAIAIQAQGNVSSRAIALNDQGVSLFSSGQNSAAIERFEQAALLLPDDAVTQLN